MIRIFVVLSTLLVVQSLSFTFLLKDRVQCFQEQVGRDVVMAMQVITNSTQYSFNAQVARQQVIVGQRQAQKKFESLYNSTNTLLVRFTHTTEEMDTAMKFCFTPNLLGKAYRDQPIKVDINFKMGSEMNDYSQIANNQQLNNVDLKLLSLVELKKDIKQGFVFLRERIQNKSQEQSKLSRKIVGFGLCSIGTFLLLQYYCTYKMKRIILQKKNQ